jgi:outer membrane immunogenic protein
MRNLLLAGAALAVLIGGNSAQAADLAVKAPVYKAPVVPPFSWTGFYIGANVGGAWGNTDWTFVTTPPLDASHHASGALAGGTLGYNWQIPSTNWVFGVEGDFDWADIKGSTACPNPSFTCQSKITEFGTARGRLGYAVGHFLAYGTGGVAWGRDQIGAVLTPAAGNDTDTGTRTGWAAGAGIEYAFWGPWSAKVEYLHYDLGTATREAPSFGAPADTRERGDLVRVGVNWKFWP